MRERFILTALGGMLNGDIQQFRSWGCRPGAPMTVRVPPQFEMRSSLGNEPIDLGMICKEVRFVWSGRWTDDSVMIYELELPT